MEGEECRMIPKSGENKQEMGVLTGLFCAMSRLTGMGPPESSR